MKKMLASVTASLMFCLSIPAQIQTFSAEEPRSNICCFTDDGGNLNHHNYYGLRHNFAIPAYSFLTPLPDGRWMRVQSDSSRVMEIMVEYYDADFHLTDRFDVPRLLPDFGTFYIASDGTYYVVTTNEIGNLTTLDEPKFDIAKYSSDWKLLDHVQTLGINVVEAVSAGTLRCADNGQRLVIHTSHERKDGHQSNYSLEVDMENMEITYEGEDRGYVSHSFNQFVLFDGNDVLMLDQGDYYPRAVQLFKNYGSYAKMVEYAPLGDVDTNDMNIINYTGVAVGGFEKSSTHYLVAYHAIDPDQWYDLAVSGRYEYSETVRNVFIASVPKNQLSTANVETIPITAYPEGSTSGGNPYLVPVGEDRFLLMWAHGEEVCYQFLDGTGQPTGEQYTMEGRLSDCEPVISENKVYWYTWKNSDVRFYSIDLEHPEQTETFIRVAGHEFEPASEPDADGNVFNVCTKCGLRVAPDAPKYMIGLRRLIPQDGLIYKAEFFPDREYLDAGDKFEYYVNENGVQDLWIDGDITKGEDYASYGGKTKRFVINDFDEPAVTLLLEVGKSSHPRKEKNYLITAKHNFELQEIRELSGGEDGSITLKCTGCGHVSTFAMNSMKGLNDEPVNITLTGSGQQEPAVTLTDPASGDIITAEQGTDYTVAYVNGPEGNTYIVIVAARESEKIEGSAVLQSASAVHPDPVSGDADGDGQVQKQDAEMLLRWLCCYPDAEITDSAGADMNHDGKLDATDLTLLKRAI